MIIDVVISLIVVWSTFKGLKKGLIMSVTSLLGLFISLLLASKHLNYLYSNIVKFLKIDNFPISVDENYYIYIASYLIFVMFFHLLIYFLALFIRSFFGLFMLGWIDKFFGILFGFIQGIVVSICLVIVLNFLAKFNDSIKNIYIRSEMIRILPDISIFTLSILPEEISKNLRNYIDSFTDMLR